MMELLVSAVVAGAIAGGFVFLAQTAAWRLCRRSATLTRWLAVAAIAVWSATALFHLLSALRSYTRGAALACVALLAGAAWVVDARAECPRQWRQHDRVFLRRAGRTLTRSRYLPVLALFVLCALPAVIRTLLLPPLGWDALTYHSVKSALWVQHGALGAMNGPGPWAYYRNMPGGSEVLNAWAMLASFSDAFTPFVEIAEWLGIGLGTMVLARQLGVREPFASTAAGFVMSIPTVRLLLGSGYVELCLLFSFLAGLVLALAATRDRPGMLIVSGGMLGVAAATKVPMYAVAGLPLAIVLVLSLWRGTRVARTCAIIAALAFLVPVLPWMIAAAVDTGAPFSPVPLHLGPLALGRSPAELAWYIDRPLLPGLAQELPALRTMFSPPNQHTEALGLLLLVPLAGMVLGIAPLSRRRPLAMALFAAATFCAGASYLSHDFAVVRQYWTENSSRFLLVVAAIVVVISVGWCRRRSVAAHLYATLLAGCAIWNLAANAFVGFSDVSRHAVAVTAGALVATVAIWWAITWLPQRRWRTTIGLCVTLAAGVALPSYRDQLRPALLQTDFTIHWFASSNYWSAAVPVIDEPAAPRRIAVTSGPWQNMDNWFVYPFMGRRLQNEVVYVPISGDGRLRHFGHRGENEELAASASPWAWQLRLHQQQVTHVVSFRPPSIELGWMEADPSAFERIAGTAGDWGIFRVRTEAGHGE